MSERREYMDMSVEFAYVNLFGRWLGRCAETVENRFLRNGACLLRVYCGIIGSCNGAWNVKTFVCAIWLGALILLYL